MYSMAKLDKTESIDLNALKDDDFKHWVGFKRHIFFTFPIQNQKLKLLVSKTCLELSKQAEACIISKNYGLARDLLFKALPGLNVWWVHEKM